MAFSSKKYLALALAGAAILGAGTYLLLNNYFERINIAVAARDIEKNSKIEEKDIRMLPYYKQALPAGYVSDKSEIMGMLIKAERRSGDPLTDGIFSGEDIEKSMLEKLSEGEVLMAINLNYQEPLIDHLKIGNNISIVSTEKEKDVNSYVAANQTIAETGGTGGTTGTSGTSGNGGITGTAATGGTVDTVGTGENIAAADVSAITKDTASNETSGSAVSSAASSGVSETSNSTASESSDHIASETANSTTSESSDPASNETSASAVESIMDLNSFSLAENIMIIDGQIIIKNLKIIDIKKTDTESNGLVSAKNKSSWCIFIKCSLGEAPVIARITKEDRYKIFLEKLPAE